jgi:phosphoribosylamine--glycine ligase
LAELNAQKGAETLVFHAGTKFASDNLETNGGRVLAVSSYGNSLTEAVQKSKEVLEKIHFDGMYYRRDIGYEFPG